MGQLVSTGKKKTITEVDKAILSLKTQRRKLADYQKKVEAVMEREKEAVRSMVKEGKKSRALLALKKMKVQEEALKKADAWVMRVEEQLADVEIASRQAQVFESLKVGQKAVTELQKEMNLDDVEKLMADTEEAKAYQKEVQDALVGQLSPEDEEAALAELEELEAQLTAQEAAADAARLPSVPTHLPVRPKAEEEEEEEEGEKGEKPVQVDKQKQTAEKVSRREEPLLA